MPQAPCFQQAFQMLTGVDQAMAGDRAVLVDEHGIRQFADLVGQAHLPRQQVGVCLQTLGGNEGQVLARLTITGQHDVQALLATQRIEHRQQRLAHRTCLGQEEQQGGLPARAAQAHRATGQARQREYRRRVTGLDRLAQRQCAYRLDTLVQQPDLTRQGPHGEDQHQGDRPG
ncbi:hypothetical protein D3C72_1206540 [compost metagenome]